ncbi:hypothetical protein Droror1_Dr00011605 [Drosera rotundifolia]
MRCPASELSMCCPARSSEEAPRLEGALGPAPRQPTKQALPGSPRSSSPRRGSTRMAPPRHVRTLIRCSASLIDARPTSVLGTPSCPASASSHARRTEKSGGLRRGHDGLATGA